MKKMHLFLAIALVTLGLFILRQANSKPANRSNVIGGDVDDGGCLVGAGYSWCEAKSKCLRTWEEGCGSTSTPASKDSIPQDETACLTRGGDWGQLDKHTGCNLPTSDAGKACRNDSECEGSCIAQLTQDEYAAVTGLSSISKEKVVLEKNGQCTDWVLAYGCKAHVLDGKVENVLCID